MRTPILNAVRRHKLWPRTFKTDDLARVMHDFPCPMVRILPKPHNSSMGFNPPAYRQETRQPINTSSLVLDRDFHLMFDLRQKFGLGSDQDVITLAGFIKLVESDEVLKRLRFIGETQYFKLLEADTITIAHDLMSTVDEHIFVGSRHMKIEQLDLANNDWYGADGLLKNTVVTFTASLRIDCQPYCDATLGYCPGCLDDEIILERKEKGSGDDESLPDYDIPKSREIQPTIEVTSAGSDIPPSGSVLVVTPKGVTRIGTCPTAPRKKNGGRFPHRKHTGTDQCSQCNELHENPCHQS